MLTCQQMTQIVTDYLEGALPFGKRMGIAMHLAMCRHCRRYFRQVKKVAGDCEKLQKLEMPGDVADSLDKIFTDLALGPDEPT